MCRGDQSHLPNYKLLTTPNTNYTPGPPLLSEEPDTLVARPPPTNGVGNGVTSRVGNGVTITLSFPPASCEISIAPYDSAD